MTQKRALEVNTNAAPPGPRRRSALHGLARFCFAPLSFIEDAARKYGDIARLPLGTQDIYFVNSPTFIKDILVTNQVQFGRNRVFERARLLMGNGLITSDGAEHLRQRRLVQPYFHQPRIAEHCDTVADLVSAYQERLRPDVPFDLAQDMMRLTLNIVARSLFSADLDEEAAEISGVLTDIFAGWGLLVFPFLESLEQMPLLPARRLHKAGQRLDAAIYRLIAERRASGNPPDDLLSVLLQAQRASGGSWMSDEQVRDQILTFLMGGQETTANALTWAWYLLSQNPEAEGRFHEEIDRVLGNRQPAAGDLPQLRFTEAVFAETLRLYPSGWLIARRTLCEYHIDQYLVPANTVIVMSPYLVQRDERWFPNPHEFRPERWLIPGADRHAQHSKFVYFPFSRGMRNCIGERFAWMEGVLALATIGLRWRLRLEPGHRVKMQPLIVSRAEYGMRMIAERRSPTAPDTARTSGAVRPAHPQSHQCPAGFTDSSKCVADPRRVENG